MNAKSLPIQCLYIFYSKQPTTSAFITPLAGSPFSPAANRGGHPFNVVVLVEIKPRPSAANENILGNYLASLVRSLSWPFVLCGHVDSPNFKRISVK